MLNNLRRKRVQRSNVEICDELRNLTSIWWSKDMLVYDVRCTNLGNQRYSKETTQKSFEYYKPKLNLIPYYNIGNEIYNLILCPSGSFIKGSDREKDKNPIEKMTIEKSFLLGETEITQELYYAFMNKNPSKFKSDAKNPVERISWYDALIFCNRLSDMFKLERYYTITKDGKIVDKIAKEQKDYVVEMNLTSKGFRLPTEWEWEYAAKAGTQLLYSGSDNVDDVAWYDGNSGGTTHEIKGKNPNAWGFYDMSGNVKEWCENESNHSTWDNRVVRGGGWSSSASYLHSAYHYKTPPYYRDEDLGFRVCRYI